VVGIAVGVVLLVAAALACFIVLGGLTLLKH
jgi:hypothetical protein